MFYRVRQRAKKTWFNIRCKDIFRTPRLESPPSGVVIVSMISHYDLAMYLVAIKSLIKALGGVETLVVDDGTLTEADANVVASHVSPLRMVDVGDVHCGKCPKGGCWERLRVISENIGQNYVIQMDSDTVTLGAIPEVLSCIKENRSFTLGTGMGKNIVPAREISREMRAFKSDYVQVLAEQNLEQLENAKELRYVRGCAGFAGFARGSFEWSRVEGLSQSMEQLIGGKWSEWGSEQVASNFIIANSEGARVLPYPKYANFSPGVPHEESSFLHFIGPTRFRNGVYINRARSVVRMLLANSQNITAAGN